MTARQALKALRGSNCPVKADRQLVIIVHALEAIHDQLAAYPRVIDLDYMLKLAHKALNETGETRV